MVLHNNSSCSRCGGGLIFYDRVSRLLKTKGGKVKRIKIKRYKCSNCNAVHRKLPSYILPHKHYEKEIVQGVLDGYITSETLGYEDYPCETTMKRWRSQKLQGLL